MRERDTIRLTVWIHYFDEIEHARIIDVGSDVERNIVFKGKRPTTKGAEMMVHVL